MHKIVIYYADILVRQNNRLEREFFIKAWPDIGCEVSADYSSPCLAGSLILITLLIIIIETWLLLPSSGQAPVQLNWAELATILSLLNSQPPSHPPTRDSIKTETPPPYPKSS